MQLEHHQILSTLQIVFRYPYVHWLNCLETIVNNKLIKVIKCNILFLSLTQIHTVTTMLFKMNLGTSIYDDYVTRYYN